MKEKKNKKKSIPEERESSSKTSSAAEISSQEKKHPGSFPGKVLWNILKMVTRRTREMNQRTKRLMTMENALHTRDDIDFK